MTCTGRPYDETAEKVRSMDRARKSYYNYYTSKKWGALESYDLFVNSSLMNIEKTTDFIIKYIDEI